MDQSVDEERLNEYQNRVSEWIGEQGIIFQLRYAGIVGNYSISKQLGSLLVKLAIFVVTVVAIGYFFLARHSSTDRYRDKLSDQIAEVLGTEEIVIAHFSRARGQGTFREIELLGGEESFFIEGRIGNMNAPFDLLSGISERWVPSELTISGASFQLKAGGEEEEMSAAYQVILDTFEGGPLESILIEKLNVDWGYSKLTYGAIEGTSLRADFTDGVWNVTLEGGKFSQNWLQNLNLIEAKLLVTSTGVEVKTLNLELAEGTLNLSGSIGGTLGFPEFDLSGTMGSLPIDSLVQLPGVRVRDFMSGNISGELAITGSTNRRIVMSGKVNLEDADLVTFREKWEILKTMSVLDISRSYRRVDFDQVSFEFKTEGGRMEINDLDLRSGNLIQLKGDLVSKLPTQKEAADSLGIVLTEGYGNGVNPDVTDTSSALDLENDRMTLKRVAGGGKVNDFDIEIEDAGVDASPNESESLSPKELEAQRLRYEMNVHRIEGDLSFGIAEDAVADYPSLVNLYPADEEGLRWLPLKFQSTFSKITTEESIRLLEDSRIKVNTPPSSE
ncbi:MAG: hypothetical protein ACON4K_02475 [Akkermansiaceae bacterium]